MKPQIYIHIVAVVWKFRISIHSMPKRNKNGYHKSGTDNYWAKTCLSIHELSLGWVSVAYLTEIPNPNYKADWL